DFHVTGVQTCALPILRPPNRLAEPGRICRAVTPPASAVSKPGSWGQTLCSAQTSAVLGADISLPSACASTEGEGYTPRCECTSRSEEHTSELQSRENL